ncbi:MAG: 1-acyl-sn-glycerol-3-phosphate acyltransferase [Candidatus Gastranaerophilales bacterium]|nr:1-acyl-sn-glycerol-3-phosphate acyltransferase [Candidatus Gastranaerophilales bacterium]
MASKFSTRTPKEYNTFRTVFQYIACNWVIINILRSKYNVLKPQGLENIDRTKKYVIASNHVTGFDPFSVAANLKMTIAYMAKVQLFETFWSMVLMDWCGAFAVDRDKVDVSTIKTALSIKKTKWHLGIFPQGTRRQDGKLGDFTKGFASMAKKMDADILPVGIMVKENPNSKKKDIQFRVAEPISCKLPVDDIAENWAKTVSKLAELEYIPAT